MKTIASIISFSFVLTLSAQETKLQEAKQAYTPEQVAELQTKRMELEFELTDKQRKELYHLNLETAQKRAAKRDELRAQKLAQKSLTTDEQYQLQIERLDAVKKHQSEMKRILGDEKYAVWKEKNIQRIEKRKHTIRQKRSEFRKNRNHNI